MLVSVVLPAAWPAYVCPADSRGIFNTSRLVRGVSTDPDGLIAVCYSARSGEAAETGRQRGLRFLPQSFPHLWKTLWKNLQFLLS